MWRTKMLAIIGGLVVGGILFRRFDGPGEFALLKLSYQALLLLGGIGLGGVFPAARFWGPFGMSAAPLLMLFVGTPVTANPFLLFVVAFGFVLGFPAPLIGGAISRALSRKQLPRLFYLAVLASTLAAAAVVPGIALRQGVNARQRLEAERIPALLRRIYEAEMSRSAGQPDRTFTCDGTELPGVSGFGWSSTVLSGEGSGTQKFAEARGVRWYLTKAKNFGEEGGIKVILDCPEEVSPHGFRATGFSLFPFPLPTFSIDQTGELTVTKGRRVAQLIQ